MKVAITGASGFIGSNLVPYIAKCGHDIVMISRTKGLNICDWSSLQQVEKCDAIIHLAARTFVPDSFENPREFYQTNYIATLNALELARTWKAKFINVSSYFYGLPEYLPVDELHSLHPHNPYAQSKMQSEDMCDAYARDFNVSCISFRLFNIYGPGQNTRFLIPEIIEKLRKGGKVVFNDPRPKRDYIHVADVVKVLEASLSVANTNHDKYNLGTGQSTSVADLVRLIQAVIGSRAEVEFLHKYRKNEVLDSVADTSKLLSVFKVDPFMSLKDGIKTMI